MRLTARDTQLVKDIGLSHTMSRDQIVALRYFTSVTRANTRLRELGAEGFVYRIKTPFFGQSLYMAGPNAANIVGERVIPLLANRASSPRFIQHALCVTNTRIALFERGGTNWRFEQQLWRKFEYEGRTYEVRPDGLSQLPKGPMIVEVDLGHVAPAKFKEKLNAYDAFLKSGACEHLWDLSEFAVLTVTIGDLRASRLQRQTPHDSSFEHVCTTFKALNIPAIGGWS